MIILFHRPPFPANPSDTREEGDTTVYYKNSDTWAIQSLSFTEGDEALSIAITGLHKRRYTYTFTIDVPAKAGGVYELFYNTSRKAPVARDYKIINPYIPTAGIPAADMIYVGRVHFEDEQTLVFIRSHFADIDGVTNKQITDESQSSIDAMAEYSETAAEVFAAVKAKRNFLNDVDALDSTSYLEAQVDILTKIILAAGLATGDDLEVLTAADAAGIWRSNDKDKLLQKMVDKASFREKQLAYYSAIE